MWFLITVDTEEDGAYRCVVDTTHSASAERYARKYYQEEGFTVESAEAEMFNTFEHGDIRDYVVL